MAITKTQTTLKTIETILLKWERDEDAGMDWLDTLAVVDADSNVDVQATFESIMKEGGCTPEQARAQTASYMARVETWKNDHWHYVGCIASARVSEKDAETGETEGTEEVGESSVWGIESFSGADYQKTVEDEQIDSLRTELEKLGYSIEDADWDALPRVQSEHSYEPTDSDPGADTPPLPVLPEADADFTYRYGSKSDEKGDYAIDDAEGTVIAVCKECEVPMPNDDAKLTSDPHWYGCERFAKSAA